VPLLPSHLLSVLLALLGASRGEVYGQELVVNGGLESFKRCPTGPAVKRLKVDGKVKAAQGDPDLYATCNGPFGVPDNWSGQQAAWEGEAYAGLLLTTDMPNECGMREYLQFPLSTPLESGRRYRLTFHVSPSEHSGYVTDRVAALFTEEDQAAKGLSPASRERADVENAHGRMLGDTAGWTTITGIHNARGGERFVLIGNFHTCNSSTRIRMDGSKKASMERKASARMDPNARRSAWREWMSRAAYVYLDGVSLVPDSTSPERINVLMPELACPAEVPEATGPELIPDPGFDRNLHPTPDSWRNASDGTPDLYDGETGLYLYSDGYTDNREYIRIPLADTLSPCSTYRVSLDVRLNPTYAFAVDAIGVAVSDTFNTRRDRLRIDLPWAWRSPPGALMAQSDRSMTLCGTFTPTVCARHLFVGNFGPDSSTTIVQVGTDGDGPFAYSFVDNIHLAAVSSVPGCVDPCPAAVHGVVGSNTNTFEWPDRIILHFDSDSDLPLEVDAGALDRLATTLNADRSMSLHITGHADGSGTPARNRTLAQARADRLRELLLQRGAPPESILTYTQGSSRPIADNANPEGRAMNRRVEVEVRR
jgi:hypothetical protein